MSEYVIPLLAQSFIEENFFEWSFNKPAEFQPSKELFLKLTHPAELHYLAHIYNWDDGPLILEWILESELCSRSTANLIFWRSAPEWYMEFSLSDPESCPSINRDAFYVIIKVLEKYKNNTFNSCQIEFDPASEIEEITTEDPRWEIPSGMYDIINGVAILIEE